MARTLQTAPALNRGAKKAVAPVPPSSSSSYADNARLGDLKETCPLCVEELDNTDKEFYPCPCGYQVCLFCYGQVKEQCGGLCPGCRREYGEPVDAAVVKAHAEERATAACGTARSFTAALKAPATRIAAGVSVGGGATAAVAGARGGHASGQLPPPGAARSAASSRRGANEHGVLPSGATWGEPRPAPSDGKRDIAGGDLADESAWPSLPSGVHAKQAFLASMSSVLSHQRSMSGSSTCVESDGSLCSSSPQRSGGSSQNLSVAVDTAKQAGARLMGMLRQGAMAGKAPSPMSAGAQPVLASAQQPPLITTQDPSLPGPPVCKHQPIQPPCSQGTGQGSMDVDQSREASNGQQQEQESSYSVWSGLPGIDVGMLQSIWTAHAHELTFPCQDIWMTAGSHFPSMDVRLASKPPPPGFGHVSLMDGLSRPCPPPGFMLYNPPLSTAI
mmetsp:Transcript_23287/g.69162  ORF Transcript_23287/g.69162 Transcript_23287/m.69162 type:complete len:446 (-) Transcript_23287:57-1394(-)